MCLVSRELDADEPTGGGEELIETMGPGCAEGGRQGGEELSVIISSDYSIENGL